MYAREKSEHKFKSLLTKERQPNTPHPSIKVTLNIQLLAIKESLVLDQHSIRKQLENQTTYMKQLFSDIGQQAEQGCDPYEKGNKLREPYSHPGFVFRSTSHITMQGGDTPCRVLQSCRAEKREMGDQGGRGSLDLWGTVPEKRNPHRKNSSRYLQWSHLEFLIEYQSVLVYRRHHENRHRTIRKRTTNREE